MSDPNITSASAAQPPLGLRQQSLVEQLGKPVALLLLAIGIGSLLLFGEIVIRNVGGPSVADLSAVFVASTLSSIAGFAFSAICGAMLFHLLTKPVQIVQIMLVCSIAIQALCVASLRNAIDWKSLARFFLAGWSGCRLGFIC
jgi:hypothetical protein